MEFNPVNFIEKYIDLIDNDKFEEFYDTLDREISSENKSVIGDITKVLNNAGINPLDYLDYVPLYYCSYRTDLPSELILPDNIKYIGTSAFCFCTSLEKVILPEGLTVIYPDAFAACVELKNINLPSSLKEIKHRAFFNCRELTKQNDWFQEGLQEIGRSAFWNTKVDDVIIPRSLKSLGRNMLGTEKRSINVYRDMKDFTTLKDFDVNYID